MVTGIVNKAAAEPGYLEARRRYNREYMRRWRADPRHRNCERANRERWQHLRKFQDLVHGKRVCGFCHQRAPKEEVLRLFPVPKGYVEVRVPYCGQC
jgi:hypothetical protein